jgi:threonine dehydrogenase-like Zn-dependent dehydrogenase
MKGMILGGCADLPGGLADFMVAHESQLFPVPTYVADARAVLAEPIAVAVHAVLRNPPSAGERVLVIGGGPIAFCAVLSLAELGFDADITLFTLEATHLDKARALGAHRALCPRDGQLIDVAAELTHAPRLKPVLGRDFLAGGFDRVFDCVGSAASLADAFAVTRPGGTIVMVGAAGVMPKLDLSFLWSKEIRLVGSLGYGFEERDGTRRRTFDIALDILSSADRPVEELVTHRFAFDRVRDALRANLFREKSGAIKTVLHPEIENEVRHAEERSRRSPPPLGAARDLDGPRAGGTSSARLFMGSARQPSGWETLCGAARARSRSAPSRSPPCSIRRSTLSAARRCRPHLTSIWSTAAFSCR